MEIINQGNAKNDSLLGAQQIIITNDKLTINDTLKTPQQIISLSAAENKLTSISQNTAIKEINYYEKGMMDAKIHYKSYKDAATITFLVSAIPLFGIPIGLTSAVLMSVVPPNTNRLHYPDQKLMENEVYNYAYKNEAQKIKTNKVWINYGLGIVTGIAVLIILNH